MPLSTFTVLCNHYPHSYLCPEFFSLQNWNSTSSDKTETLHPDSCCPDPDGHPHGQFGASCGGVTGPDGRGRREPWGNSPAASMPTRDPSTTQRTRTSLPMAGPPSLRQPRGSPPLSPTYTNATGSGQTRRRPDWSALSCRLDAGGNWRTGLLRGILRQRGNLEGDRLGADPVGTRSRLCVSPSGVLRGRPSGRRGVPAQAQVIALHQGRRRPTELSQQVPSRRLPLGMYLKCVSATRGRTNHNSQKPPRSFLLCLRFWPTATRTGRGSLEAQTSEAATLGGGTWAFKNKEY